MDMYGETTAYVYGILLRQLTEGLPRCRDDSRMHVRVVDDIPEGPRFVTTGEVFEHIKPSVDLSSGLGKCHSRAINTRAAEKIRRYCPAGNSLPAEAEDDGAASEDEDGGDESGESDDDENAESDNKEADDEPHVNGTREGRVKFAASTGKEPPRLDRTSQLRQHLLLLAQSKQGFVRHCGTQEWTVDFEHLLHQLKEAELDSIIEQTCGRFGLRLVHILRSKGKLDEKTLHNLGLMKKPDVQRKMLEMEVHGFVHVQEVPKDSKHDVKKSIFLWFCDVEKTLGLLLQNTYKTMLRCMQTLALLQQRDQDVLMLTKRSNVKGREQDVMRKEYFDRYSMFLTKERRLLAQVHRLDELVGVLRDY